MKIVTRRQCIVALFGNTLTVQELIAELAEIEDQCAFVVFLQDSSEGSPQHYTNTITEVFPYDTSNTELTETIKSESGIGFAYSFPATSTEEIPIVFIG